MKKCAVYTRASTSMQAEVEYNSCEVQKDKILSYIKSQEGLEVYREYLLAGLVKCSECSSGMARKPAL